MFCLNAGIPWGRGRGRGKGRGRGRGRGRRNAGNYNNKLIKLHLTVI